jgi:hypothetical protein
MGEAAHDATRPDKSIEIARKFVSTMSLVWPVVSVKRTPYW